MTKKKIQQIAESYQEVSREIKAKQSEQKAFKEQLLEYAEKNNKEFDDAFQLKFDCGVFVSKRESDVLTGSKDDKAKLLEKREEFSQVKLDEKKVIEQAKSDRVLSKLLGQLNLSSEKKITLAVYSN